MYSTKKEITQIANTLETEVALMKREITDREHLLVLNNKENIYLLYQPDHPVFSKMLFSSPVWASTRKRRRTLLDFRQCKRFCSTGCHWGDGKYDYIKPTIKQLHWLPIA